MSATYTTVHGNARSLTHGVRPGVEPASSWTLVEPQRELLVLYLCHSPSQPASYPCRGTGAAERRPELSRSRGFWISSPGSFNSPDHPLQPLTPHPPQSPAGMIIFCSKIEKEDMFSQRPLETILAGSCLLPHLRMGSMGLLARGSPRTVGGSRRMVGSGPSPFYITIAQKGQRLRPLQILLFSHVTTEI